jgi:hypothetical protein
MGNTNISRKNFLKNATWGLAGLSLAPGLTYPLKAEGSNNTGK